MSDLLTKLNDDLADLTQSVGRSVVQVRSGDHGGGAGVIVHTEGLVVTNAHVVRNKTLRITLQDGRTVPGRLLAIDRERDLAAVSIDAKNLTPIEMGDSKSLQAGQWVMSLGHPWGITNAVTAGVVVGTGVERHWRRGSSRDWVVVNLHLRPGYSGGPLFDDQGRLLGINTIMTGLDVGMAVPVDAVKQFLKEALESPERTPLDPDPEEEPSVVMV